MTDAPEETSPEPVTGPAEPAGRRARPSALQIGAVALMLAAALGLAAAYGLGLGPFAPATAPATAPPSTEPTLFPGTTASPPPPASTSGPDATPSAGPSSPLPSIGPVATASPSNGTERLLLHIPEEIRPDCVAVAGVEPVLATATCSADTGQITLTYLLYSSLDEMRAAYDGFVAAAEIERDTGSCGLPDTWPAEGEYRLDETIAGRLLCMDVTDRASIYWTDERLSILTLATDAANDRERLWEFWLDDSGPDL